VSACKRCPEDAVAVDVAAARSITGQWRLVDLRQRGLRRIRPRRDPNDSDRGIPNGSPRRIRRPGSPRKFINLRVGGRTH
jgi:hypothetical protein